MKLNLLVIKTAKIDQLKTQYEQLGFAFKLHQHGKGPLHYASETNDFVFEIYPLPSSETEADATTRLGFEVESLDELIEGISATELIIKQKPKATEWGYVAVVQDLDGRKIELNEKRN